MTGTGSNYIYYLEDRRNTLVGLVQGIQGIFIPLASFPGGYLADRTRRDAVLKVFGVAGFGEAPLFLPCRVHGVSHLSASQEAGNTAFCLSAVAIALLIAAVLSPQQPLPAHPSVDLKYLLLCIGYAFWGVTQASNPIVESILADSVPTGESQDLHRARCLTYRMRSFDCAAEIISFRSRNGLRWTGCRD